MYLENVDMQNRDRYAVNLSGLGLFGSKKRRRKAAAEKAAADLRIANLEQMMLLQHKPDIPPPVQAAPVVAPIGPVPVVNITAPAPQKAATPAWIIPAAIGGVGLVLVIALTGKKK